MSTKDIWYGVLEAGDKSAPVVRDLTMQAEKNHVWLYNHARNTFVEYAQAIVEPKLRELAKGDIPQDELDQAFKAARQAFISARKIRKWEDKPLPAKPASKKDDDTDIEITDDDDIDEFIDDGEDDD